MTQQGDVKEYQKLCSAVDRILEKSDEIGEELAQKWDKQAAETHDAPPAADLGRPFTW